MSDLTIGRDSVGAATQSPSDLYRAVWRWHFYAGLFVLPFLISLAITGALYLDFFDFRRRVREGLWPRRSVPENFVRTGASAMPINPPKTAGTAVAANWQRVAQGQWNALFGCKPLGTGALTVTGPCDEQNYDDGIGCRGRIAPCAKPAKTA